MTSAVGRVWHLKTSMHFIFGEGGLKLDAFDFGGLREAQTLSQYHERFTYVFEGPDAKEAADSIAELLRGATPTMKDAQFGCWSVLRRQQAGCALEASRISAVSKFSGLRNGERGGC